MITLIGVGCAMVVVKNPSVVIFIDMDFSWICDGKSGVSLRRLRSDEKDGGPTGFLNLSLLFPIE